MKPQPMTLATRRNGGKWPTEPQEEAGTRPTHTAALTLVIASEVRFLRESLSEALGRSPAISIVGFAADGDQAVRVSRELHPNMLLLDAAMREGPNAVRRLRESLTRILVVAFALSETVESVLTWAEAGVAGYIPNTAAVSDLQAMLGDIRSGRQICSPFVAAGLLRRVAAGPLRPADEAATLTPREIEIVRLVGAGLSNKEIARRLDISLATTKSHVHNALGKLNVQRRGQIAACLHASLPSGAALAVPSRS